MGSRWPWERLRHHPAMAKVLAREEQGPPAPAPSPAMEDGVREVSRRRARSTGTTVVLQDERAKGDPDERWATVCEDHGGIVYHLTRNAAESWMAVPEGWCPTCQEKKAPE